MQKSESPGIDRELNTDSDMGLEAALGRVRNKIGRVVLRQAVNRIGRYRAVKELGHGGFGVVYLAEQNEPVHRSVAIKLLDPTRATDTARRHFELERKALAQLSHPNIATMIDAGETEDGQLYLVMELVARGDGDTVEPGCTITQFCDRHVLSIRERLELFVQVCDAVQHAHSRGIIHRDIKPSNILVSEVQNGESLAPLAVPKVIDFGISTLLDPETHAAKSHVTLAGTVLGSPSYMSPEQAEGRNGDISIRTDVYGLGALLYELLTGKSWLSAEGSSVPELLQQIVTLDPTPPSRLGMGSGCGEWELIATARDTDASTLERTLRQELEWIPLKAMQKDPQQRYSTASELAADVRRYLAGEALVAGPESRAYRVHKFVSRHRVPVAAAVAVMLALNAGLAVSLWQRSEALAASNAEKERAEQLTKVSDFQTKMLSQIDTTMAGIALMNDVRERFVAALEKAGVPGAERTARLDALQQELVRVNATDVAAAMIDRTILTPAINAIDDQFTDDPRTDASLRQALADLYSTIGRYDAALPLQESALATRRRVLGDEHPDTLTSIHKMATILHETGRLDEAEVSYREALEGRKRLHGEEHEATLVTMNNMGALLRAQRRFDHAERYLREVLEKRKLLHGEEHEGTLLAMNNMGMLCRDQGRADECEAFFGEFLEKSRRVLGEEHRNTLLALNNMTALLWSQNRLTEAEPLARELYDKCHRVLGDAHPWTLVAINTMGSVLFSQGKLADAEPLLREALRMRRRVLGEENPHTLTSINNLGKVLATQGKFADAEPYHHEAFERRRRLLGESDPGTRDSMLALVYLYTAWDSAEPGKGYGEKAIEWKAKIPPSDASKPLQGK